MASNNITWGDIKWAKELGNKIQNIDLNPEGCFTKYISTIMENAFHHNYFIYDQYTPDPITLKRSQNYDIYNEYDSLFLKYLKQHPAVQQIPQADGGVSGSFRSLLSQKEYHQLDLYKKIYSKLGVEDQMWIGWEDDGILNYVAYSRETPFSAKEMAKLIMVQHHLMTAAKKWYASEGKSEALSIKAQDKPAFMLQGIPPNLSGRNLKKKSKLKHPDESRAPYSYKDLTDFKYVGIYDLGEDAIDISENDSFQINMFIANLKKEGVLLVSAAEAENNPTDTPFRTFYELFFNQSEMSHYVGLTSPNRICDPYFDDPTIEYIEPPDDSSRNPFYKSFNTALKKLFENETEITSLCGDEEPKPTKPHRNKIIKLCDKSHSVQVEDFVPVEFNSIKQYAVFKATLELSDKKYAGPVNLKEIAKRAGEIEQQLTPQEDQKKNIGRFISSPEEVSKIVFDLRDYTNKPHSRLAFLKPLILRPRQTRVDLTNYDVDFNASLSGARKISEY